MNQSLPVSDLLQTEEHQQRSGVLVCPSLTEQLTVIVYPTHEEARKAFEERIQRVLLN